MINKIKTLLIKYQEIIAYLFWGILTTIVNWGTYSMSILLLQHYSLSFQIFKLEISGVIFFSNVISWICAVLFAYVTNKLWVFNSKSWETKIVIPEFGKFVSTRLVTGGMEMIAVPLLVSVGMNQVIWGIERGLAKIVVSILVVILNYICSKLFIFK